MTSSASIARMFFLAAMLILSGSIVAADEWSACASKVDDKERLNCYDTIKAAIQSPQAQISVDGGVPRSYLTRTWDLDSRDDELLGESQSPLRPHRITYLIARKTSQANSQPASPTHSPSAALMDIDPTELKFRFSQKAKVLNPVSMNFLGFTGFRLWAAYTQQSNWQAFNAGNSSPFRETNYEPELIVTFRTGNQYGLKLLNIGYSHQSNGRNLSDSRSWNRTFIQGGWETDTLSLMVRGWWRIPENIANDDNPDIEEYVGRGDFSLRWEPLDRSQMVDMTLRNNFQAKDNRGLIQLDWATPVTVSKSTKLHIQLTSGYGESLIDYNYFQTTLGLGVSFRDW